MDAPRATNLIHHKHQEALLHAIVNIYAVRNCIALFIRSKVQFQSKIELYPASVHLFLKSTLITTAVWPDVVVFDNNMVSGSLWDEQRTAVPVQKVVVKEQFPLCRKVGTVPSLFHPERPILWKSYKVWHHEEGILHLPDDQQKIRSLLYWISWKR